MRCTINIYGSVVLMIFTCGAIAQGVKPKPRQEMDEKERKEIVRRMQQTVFTVSDFISQRKVLTDGNGNSGINGNPDTDNDQLSDNEELFMGTDPANPDTDGDGLLDGWETSQTNGIDLRKMGASPLHKDIFVQMDYMLRSDAINGLEPNADVIRGIEESFALSPVKNPDGYEGIFIHLIIGNEVEYKENLTSDYEDFRRIKSKYFDRKREPIFHYMIWANAYDNTSSSGYSYNIPGADFIVTLGKWNDGRGGTNDQKIGTFIHELGHNLGLMHGGLDDVNYKPNYLSVMNYYFQISGLIRGHERFYEYQSIDLGDLDESLLYEPNGLNNNLLQANDTTAFFNEFGGITSCSAAGVIDWNQNGIEDSTTTKEDLNYDTEHTVLKGCTAEWLRLFYKGGAIGSTQKLKGLTEYILKQERKPPKNELSEDMFLKQIKR